MLLTGVPNCAEGAVPNLKGVEGCAFEGVGCGGVLPKVKVPELGAAEGAAELPKEKEGLARVPKEGAVVGGPRAGAAAAACEL